MIAVQLEYGPDSEERLSLRPQHRQRLAAHLESGLLIAAGPYAGDTGALILFAGTREQVEAALSEDPYYATPGVTSISLHDWTPSVGGVSTGD